MANSLTHVLPYPILNARYTTPLTFRTSDGTLTDPTTPDTEISVDGGASFSDCAEEITTGGGNGAGYLTLTGAETNNSTSILAAKSANCATTPVIIQPRRLAIVGSGTLSAGSAGGGTLGTLLAYDVTGCFIRTTGGTGGGGTGGANNQARRIITYDTSTGAFTVSPNWETTPSTDTTYDVLLPEGVTLGMLKALNPTTPGRTATVDSSGRVLSDLDTIKTQSVTCSGGVTIPAATLASTTNITAGTITTATTATNVTTVSSGAISAASFASGAIDAAAIATDALGALELSSGAASEIASAVRTELATELGRIDDAITSRMASYTQPTGFLAATFPATVASTTNITSATGITVSAIGAGVITAASIASDAITDAKVASDVTIASVTGSVGSVTGNVGGNVVGSVASVTAAVTLPTIPTNWITADGIATDAFGALELAADAASEIATAVRTELATELARVDVAISTRLATAGYTAPPSAATNATAVRTELATELARIDVATSTRLATAGYTAPPSAATNASAVRTELATELARIDVASSTLATAANLATANTALAKFTTMVVQDGAVYQYTANALELGPSGGGGGGSVEVDSFSNDALAQLAALDTINVTGAVTGSGVVNLTQGGDYLDEDGRDLQFVNAAGSLPDLTGATPYLVLKNAGVTHAAITGTVITPTGANQRVDFDVPRAVTDLLVAERGIYEVYAVLATSGDVIPISSGVLNVVLKIRA